MSDEAVKRCGAYDRKSDNINEDLSMPLVLNIKY